MCAVYLKRMHARYGWRLYPGVCGFPLGKRLGLCLLLTCGLGLLPDCCFAQLDAGQHHASGLASQMQARRQRLGGVFLRAYARQPGVRALGNMGNKGGWYRVLRTGHAPTRPTARQVFYQVRGRNGQILHTQDWVPVRADPAGGMPPGIQQALAMMLPGSVWELVLPPHLAYGERGLPGAICTAQTVVVYVAVRRLASAAVSQPDRAAPLASAQRRQ